MHRGTVRILTAGSVQMRRDLLGRQSNAVELYRAGAVHGRQRHFAVADKRRPAALEREQPNNLTENQLAAWKALARCYRALGADGSALVNDVLIDAKTAKQIAELRGRTVRTGSDFTPGGFGNA